MQTRQLIPMEENRETSESPTPLLLISHGEWFERHLIYNISDNRCKMLDIPVLCNKKVLGSSHGWLILVGYYNTEECCLFNPVSMDIIALPPMSKIFRFSHKQCILTKPPTEPDCHILFCGGNRLSLCRIGDNEFVNLSYQPTPEKPNIQYCVFGAIGNFHGQTYGFITYPRHQFFRIHFKEKNLEFRLVKLTGSPRLIPGPSLSHDDTRWIPRTSLSYDIWLIESPQEFCSDGKAEVELLMIQKVHLIGLEFIIFRVDMNEGSCTEVLNLGKRTIFLSDNGGGYCCNSVEGVKPNCIYYLNRSDPKAKRNDRNLHIFDLEDGCTTSQLPSDGVGYHSLTSWVHNINLFSHQFHSSNSVHI